jgi:TRAP-type C4-dicarboxylate transport system permease small subunit
MPEHPRPQEDRGVIATGLRAGAGVSALLGGWIAVATTIAVLGRYLFNRPIVLLFELVEFSLLAMTMLAVGYVAHRDRHVRVEFGELGGGPVTRRSFRGLTNIFSALVGTVLGAVVAGAALWVAIGDYQNDIRMLTRYRPPRWPIVSVIFVGMAMLAVQQARVLVRSLRGEAPPAASELVDEETPPLL